MEISKNIIALVIALVFSVTNIAFGELIDTEELKGSILGLGVLYSTQPYTDVDEDVWVVPIIKGRYKKFYIDGRSLGYVFNDSEEFEFSVLLSLFGQDDFGCPPGRFSNNLRAFFGMSAGRDKLIPFIRSIKPVGLPHHLLMNLPTDGGAIFFYKALVQIGGQAITDKPCSLRIFDCL